MPDVIETIPCHVTTMADGMTVTAMMTCMTEREAAKKLLVRCNRSSHLTAKKMTKLLDAVNKGSSKSSKDSSCHVTPAILNSDTSTSVIGGMLSFVVRAAVGNESAYISSAIRVSSSAVMNSSLQL